MDFSSGDKVIYGGCQMCIVGDVEEKSLDGVSFDEYVKLIPVDAPNSRYFVQCDKLGDRVRPLLSKDGVLSYIDSLSDLTAEWIPDRTKRRSEFSETLKCSDYSKLLPMVKALCDEKKKRRDAGKSLMSSDEKALDSATRLISNEFSEVLGISPEELPSFISRRTGTSPCWVGSADGHQGTA
ncbi:MAG: hypothetical protein J6F31_03170 [Oscillospiraceae bacterium]|nr:hypothetical protein [Oscillospiraceae bacterium]